MFGLNFHETSQEKGFEFENAIVAACAERNIIGYARITDALRMVFGLVSGC